MDTFMRVGGVAVLCACLMGLTMAFAADDRYLAYSGTAVGRHSGKFLYGERHFMRFEQGRLAERVVLYTCLDGTPFARKNVTYVDPLAPDFVLEVATTGMREGIRTQNGGRSVFFRSNRVDAEKAGPLPPDPELVADTGFDEYIRANWHTLMAGKTKDLHFLVPSRLEELDFKAQHVRRDTVDGISAEVFRLKLAGVWGLVLPGIDVSYGADDHTLLRYDGLSDLRDPSGDNLQAQITFPSGDRTPSSAEQIAEARRAPLSTCK